MSEFKETHEIIVRVAGPNKAGKTAIASVVDNALRANGIVSKVESDSSLSYLNESKNHVPANITVRLIDGDGGVERGAGNFDALIPIKGRIEEIVIKADDLGRFPLYRIEYIAGVDVTTWVGDFIDIADAEEAAIALAVKYGVNWIGVNSLTEEE